MIIEYRTHGAGYSQEYATAHPTFEAARFDLFKDMIARSLAYDHFSDEYAECIDAAYRAARLTMENPESENDLGDSMGIVAVTE